MSRKTSKITSAAMIGYDDPKLNPSKMGSLYSKPDGTILWELEKIVCRWIRNGQHIGYYVKYVGYE